MRTELPRAWRKENLVKWAIKRYPEEHPTKFKRMKIAQLWAIFYMW